MSILQSDTPSVEPRFSRNDVFYAASLLALFVGLVLQYGLSLALVVIGAVGVSTSVATSFFVTWLSEKK